MDLGAQYLVTQAQESASWKWLWISRGTYSLEELNAYVWYLRRGGGAEC